MCRTYITALRCTEFNDHSSFIELQRCECGFCVAMPTGLECVCCCEISQVQAKKELENVQCITLHPGFQSVCLDVWVLQTAYFSIRQHYGDDVHQGTIQE